MFKLTQHKGFKSYLIAIFLNAFIVTGHLVLLAQMMSRLVVADDALWLLLGVTAMISIPFILLFSSAGLLADHFDKALVQRWSAVAMTLLTLWLLLCHSEGWLWWSYGSVALFSIERALSSPSRYAYLKQAFGKKFIAQGNALVVIVSAVAVLLAIVVISLMYDHSYIVSRLNRGVVSTTKTVMLATPTTLFLVLGALLQLFFVFRLPAVSRVNLGKMKGVLSWIVEPSLREDFQTMIKNPVILACLAGVISFWSTSVVLFICFPEYLHSQQAAHMPLGYPELIVMGLLGMALGSIYAGKLSKLFIESGYVVLAAIGITASLLILPSLSSTLFIQLVFLAYGFFGGLLLVPLNALVQFGTETSRLGGVIGIIGGVLHILMLFVVALTVVFLVIGVDSIYLLRAIFVIALLVAVFTLIWVPQGLVCYVIYFVASRFFDIDVYGFENLPSSGPVLLLGNHTSYMDWAIIQIVSPRPVRFAMSRNVYEKWYLKAILRAFKIIPISKTIDKESIRTISAALDDGEVVALFPEGYLSHNGQIGTFHADFEQILERTQVDVNVVPFYIRGLWGTGASQATERYKKLSKIKTRSVSLCLGEPELGVITAPEIKKRVFELSIVSWKYYVHSLGSLPRNWLRTAKKMGNELCVADSTGIQLSHHKFIVAVLLVAKRLKPRLLQQQNIGILLPTSAGGAIANMTVFAMGKTVVNLNYTAGVKAVRSAIESAAIKGVITSRVFIKKLQARNIDLSEVFDGVKLHYLEDIKKENPTAVALRYLLYVKCLPVSLLNVLFIKNVPSDTTAAIMFSSGSEGEPKGVELTHYNLLANIKQVVSIFNIEDADTFMSILPLFHCFGLTVTALLPLMEGATFVCHPDPTDSVKIGHMVCRYQATILFGSSTFFGLYVRSKKLHSLMFKSIRMAIAGAEKLAPQVRQSFKDKFFLDIMEGYGTTEVAPVASCNLPSKINPEDWHVHSSSKVGSVGLPLPGSAFRILDPDSLEQLALGKEGLIAIGGPQVMKGYLNNPEKTGQVLVTDETTTWYLTGDKGYLDDEGYLFIVDRYSRFAKIGGEMVGLSVVEHEVLAVLEEADSDAMAVALSDPKKGERIALLYQASVDIDTLRSKINASDIAKLMIPAFYLQVEELPKLASGKKDYVSAKAIALEHFAV